MREFMSTFMFLQRFNCISAIDAMFKKLVEEDWEQESLETNTDLIVCFLRTNYIVKEQISYYEKLLTKSITYLENNQVDSKSLLSGLY